MDNLTYTYNGNQLTKVEDATTATSYTGGTNFVNGSTAATEYTYDQNGNIKKLQRYGQTGSSTYGLVDNLTSLVFRYIVNSLVSLYNVFW